MEPFFIISGIAAVTVTVGDVDTVTACINVALNHKSRFASINKFFRFHFVNEGKKRK